MTDHSAMKLGRRVVRRPTHVPALARYKRALTLAAPPASVDWYSRVANWPMDGNDTLGDCTAAAVSHIIQQLTTYARPNGVVMSEADVVALYSATSGYVPGQPDTDQGAVETDVLNYWLSQGVQIGGTVLDKITAYASLDPGNLDDLRDSVYWFGSAYLGLALPVTAQTQDVWDVPAGGAVGDGAPGSWGGHAVPVVGYDATGFTVVTWGALKRCTPAFLSTYLDEAYAVIDGDFIAATGTAPNGFPLGQLMADLASLQQGAT